MKQTKNEIKKKQDSTEKPKQAEKVQQSQPKVQQQPKQVQTNSVQQQQPIQPKQQLQQVQQVQQVQQQQIPQQAQQEKLPQQIQVQQLSQFFNDDEFSQFLQEKQKFLDQKRVQELQKQKQKSKSKKKMFVEEEEIEQQLPVQQEEDFIDFSLQGLVKAIKLSSKDFQLFSVQAQIKTSAVLLEQKKRPFIDLICVIDVSGSMSGQKIKLVKETLFQLGDYLTENDRICLIPFNDSAQRVTRLLPYSEQNKKIIQEAIQNLTTGGGTNIAGGIELGYRVIKERKLGNGVTSIFVLSDGKDGKDHRGLAGVQELSYKYQINSAFTINCFGFGLRHDPALMSEIAKEGDGAFYFIEKLEQVDEVFVDALGGLFSVLAQNVWLTIKESGKEQNFLGAAISKIHGNQWIYDKKMKSYKIGFRQLIGGVSKEILFEIQIPPTNIQLKDNQRNGSFIECTLTAENLEGKQIINKQTQLQLAIYNENEQIAPEINEEVQTNLIRIEGAEIMNQIREQADQGEFQKGQQIIENYQNKVKQLKPNQQNLLESITKDLEIIKVSCQDQNSYQNIGKLQIISSSKQHMEKRSKGAPMEEGMQTYQNSLQQTMVQQQKSKKKK